MGKSLTFDEGMPRLEWQKVFLELTLTSCWVLLSNLVMSHKMFILSTSIDCMLIIFDEIWKFLNWIIGKSSLITVSVPDPVVINRSTFSKVLWKISWTFFKFWKEAFSFLSNSDYYHSQTFEIWYCNLMAELHFLCYHSNYIFLVSSLWKIAIQQ